MLGVAIFSAGGVGYGQSLPALNSSLIDSSDYRFTLFAGGPESGLDYPHSMVELSDGSLLVSSSLPTGTGGIYNSTGQLLRFTDSNDDGVADEPTETPITISGLPTSTLTGGEPAGTLPGTLTSMVQAGNYLFVTSSALNYDPSITVLKMNSPTSFQYAGTESMAFPGDWEHTSYAMAVEPTPGGSAGSFDLYFNIGSATDNTTTPTTSTVSAGGLFSATLHGDSIYRVTVNTSVATPTYSNVTQVAYGLRNAAGMTFDKSGNLYFEDNGIDSPTSDPTYYIDNGHEYGADTINRLTAAQLAAGPPLDFGFAHYYEAQSGTVVTDGSPSGVLPLQIFTPIEGQYMEGASEIAFTPASFAGGLNGGMLIGFHGNPLTGSANAQNPLIYWNPNTNQYVELIAGGDPNIGHLDGIYSTGDSVFLMDLNTQGNTYDASGDGSGAIYELTLVPEPTGLLSLTLGSIFLWRRTGRHVLCQNWK
jgi:hypothetical protein